MASFMRRDDDDDEYDHDDSNEMSGGGYRSQHLNHQKRGRSLFSYKNNCPRRWRGSPRTQHLINNLHDVTLKLESRLSPDQAESKALPSTRSSSFKIQNDQDEDLLSSDWLRFVQGTTKIMPLLDISSICDEDSINPEDADDCNATIGRPRCGVTPLLETKKSPVMYGKCLQQAKTGTQWTMPILNKRCTTFMSPFQDVHKRRSVSMWNNAGQAERSCSRGERPSR